MNSHKNEAEAEPLLLQSDASGSHFDSHGSQDSDTEYSRPKNTVITMQKPVAEHDYSVTGEHFDPLQRRRVEHPTSNCDTMLHLLKANIGTGILAMPDAFKNSGLVAGTLCTLGLAVICVSTMHNLVHSAHEVCRRTQTPSMTFAEVAEASFKLGPPRLRRFSSLARSVINVFLCVTQMGFCCVYIVFVAENLSLVINPYFQIQWSSQVYMAILLLPLIFLNWIRNLKLLAPFSFVANTFMGFGLSVIFYYILKDPLPSVSTRPAFASWKQIPLYFGTAIYAFEGIGMILPLENSMKTPQDFIGWNGVLNTSMVIVSCLYTAIGFFGFIKYGEEARGSITLNLPADMLAESVRLVMALSMFISFALQFYVPVEIMWPSLKSRIPTEKMQKISEYAFRTILVIITFALAEVVPNLSALISLVGAVSSSTLALICPPIISICTNWSTGYGKYRWILIKDFLLIILGIILFSTGSYVSIENILKGSPSET